MFEKGNIAPADVVHIIFTAAVVGFYIMISALNPSSIFYHIFACFAIFETFVSFLYIYQVIWLMKLHFLFQSILFVIPIFVFSVNLENLFGSAPVLDAFRLDQVKSFVSSSGSTILSSVALLVWLFRMLNTFVYIIEAEKINPSLKMNYLFSKHVLNFTSIILFVALYLSVENPIKDACFWLSFLEIALELLYIGSTLDAKGTSITFGVWVYQAALFSVPCFLFVLLLVHDYLPQEAMEFFCSYNLVQFALFIKEKPVLAVVIYFLFWALRLADTLTTLLAEHAPPISKNTRSTSKWCLTTTRSTSK